MLWLKPMEPDSRPPRSLPALAAIFFPWIARLGLAGVFLYAGTLKLLDPGAFHQDVLNFQWLRDPLAAWVALALPPLEILCALALLFRAWSRPAAFLIVGLLLAFLAALARAWALGLDIHCGCFGSSPDPVNYPLKLALDGLLLLAAGALALAPQNQVSRRGADMRCKSSPRGETQVLG